MKKLYELPTTLLDWFGSDEVRGHISLLNDSLQLSGPKRMIIPSLIQSIETGELHPQKLESKLAELIPDAPGEKITRATNILMERVVSPVMETLEEVHSYTISTSEQTPPPTQTQPTETQPEEALHDPLETGNRTKLDEMFNLPPLPKKVIEEEAPATPEERIDEAVTATFEEQAPRQEQFTEEKIEEPNQEIPPSVAEQPVMENSSTPRVFQNFATALDEHVEKNPVLEHTETQVRSESVSEKNTPTTEQFKPQPVADAETTDNADDLFDPLAGRSDISFDAKPEETLTEKIEEDPTTPTEEKTSIETAPIKPVSQQEASTEPKPATEQSSSSEEKTAEEMLMADTIDLSETNPEVETATTISVAPQGENDAPKETQDTPSEEQPSAPVAASEQQEASPEPLKPQFGGKAKPFILHEEKKEERSNEPHLNSYESIKPSFYKPAFSHEEQGSPAPVAARLEFGEDEEREQVSEAASSEPVTAKKRSIPVSYTPVTETVSPFGRTNESSNTPVHPRNIVNLKDGDAPKETSSVHPNNVVNLKDQQ
jgi:hypothetical protein